MNKYIINESALVQDVQVEKKNQNSITFIATLQEADAPNRNGRIYPKSVLEEGIRSPYIQERLRTKQLIGECNHPCDQSVQRQMSIDLKNAACIITELWWEGNLLKGKVETANTQVGRDMMGLIQQGYRAAFQLRAQGNVAPDPSTGKVVVQQPIQICTWDWVLNPSHNKAYMDNVCEQTFQNMMNLDRFDKAVALCESAAIYDNGELIPITEEYTPVTVDYSKHYGKKVKLLEEMYVPKDNDRFISLSEDKSFVMLDCDGVGTKVATDDYLLKNIRHNIKNI